jgi:hypothetical protein
MILFVASLALLGLIRGFLDPYPGPMLKLEIALFVTLLLALAAWLVLILRKPRCDSSTETAGDQAACAECKGVFNVQDMIAHSGVYMCASCKPVFLQKLAEGALANDRTKRGRPAWLPLSIIAFCLTVIIMLLWFMYHNWETPTIISR